MSIYDRISKKALTDKQLLFIRDWALNPTSYWEQSQRLGLSIPNVQHEWDMIFKKLKVTSRYAAVRLFLENCAYKS